MVPEGPGVKVIGGVVRTALGGSVIEFGGIEGCGRPSGVRFRFPFR